MTCKISFSKSILENLKHHLAVIITTCIIFFIQFIVFFLNIQNLSSYNPVYEDMYAKRIANMTLPNSGYAIPVVFVAVIIAYDFFRYLHSKKQTDFYDSLPVRRHDWFVLRFISSFLIFLVPYIICTLLEMMLLIIFHATESVYFTNLLWTFLCMILVFLITWISGALAMILTGHSVIAFFMFGIFSGYMPVVIRYLFPAYAEQYLKTFVANDNFLHYLNYLSPVGAAVELCGDYTWIPANEKKSFVIITILILLSWVLTYVLYRKRPSEAAGRAMAFEKFNPLLRILLVIPLTLYVGLLLSLVTSIASKIWMVFGFLIGSILLHGIVESVFQFDIRGMWSHKKQMLLCFALSVGFAFIFWNDVFGYNSYLPDFEDLEAISIQVSESYTGIDDGIGITEDGLYTAFQLAKDIVEQDAEIGQEWIRFKYTLKNGISIYRDYYMDFEKNAQQLDIIYATKDYKEDICKLYSEDYSRVAYVQWSDSITDVTLHLSPAKMEQLFDTYLAEYTPLTYTQVKKEVPLGEIIICFSDIENNISDYYCYVYPNFTQTISLLESYMQSEDDTKDYGSLTESVLDKYDIVSLEIYTEEEPITIRDQETIERLKDYLVLADYYYRINPTTDWELYYDGSAALETPDGIGYCSITILKDIVETFID